MLISPGNIPVHETSGLLRFEAASGLPALTAKVLRPGAEKDRTDIAPRSARSFLSIHYLWIYVINSGTNPDNTPIHS